MKIAISYPPLLSSKGTPTLAQNRQFQYFKAPTFIYPVVPAQAATLLAEAGHEVIWLDCVAEGISYAAFKEIILKERPDLIAFETKTPVVKQHWKIIDDLKNKTGPSQQGVSPRIALFGDHVTALPEESFANCGVDFVLTGGDYDSLLLHLCDCLEKYLKRGAGGYGFTQPGIYYRQDHSIKNTGSFKLTQDLDALPFIDRDLTKWRLYSQENGNYKNTPGTYIMSGRDCWYHSCAFCSWTTLYPDFRVRSVSNVLAEIEALTNKYGVREIMDDTGCFPRGDWLREFCLGLVKQDNRKRGVYFDCNARFGSLKKEDFLLMKKANFRLLLFGLESANQNTLDRLKKGVKVESIIEDCKEATMSGLYPHITIMFGYPWETYEDASKTLRLGSWLLKKGYAYTMQATLVIPYPGTPLFEECRRSGLLRSLDWDDYDMKQPIMRSKIDDARLLDMVQGMYKVSFNPEFIMRKITSIRDFNDLKYYLRAARKAAAHIFDFKHKNAAYETQVFCK